MHHEPEKPSKNVYKPAKQQTFQPVNQATVPSVRQGLAPHHHHFNPRVAVLECGDVAKEGFSTGYCFLKKRMEPTKA